MQRTATYQSERLQLYPLTIEDAAFLFELVNTDEWVQFIGQRDVKNLDDAAAYIRKILDNVNVSYLVIHLKETQTPIGIITLIKRDYLDAHDIGFAMLPVYAGKGYAYEAAKQVLDEEITSGRHHTIAAITMSSNERSINLLKKLGLHFEKQVEESGEELLVFSTVKSKQ
jgi:[ribosomal protein S5]-alanine N-acetyltransferase